MSPLTSGLFHRVIAQSHVRDPRDTELRYLSTSYRTLEHAERTGVEFIRTHSGLEQPTLEDLRALDWRVLIDSSAQPDMAVDTGSVAKPPLFRPVIDGWLLPAGYDATYRSGSQNPVDYIAGNNLDEAGAVAEGAIPEQRERARSGVWRPGMPPSHVTLQDYVDSARRKFGDLAGEFLALYPARDDDEAAAASNDAARDNSRIATHLWGASWTAHVDRPVHTYWWTHRSPAGGSGVRRAFHGSEIPYVFAHVRAGQNGWSEEDEDVSRTVSSYWVNFVATGDPNGEGLPRWDRYSPGRPDVMDLGTTFAPVPIAAPEKVDFWQRFLATQTAW
jgi:carboxylesterase type B